MPKGHSIAGSKRAFLKRLGTITLAVQEPRPSFFVSGELIFKYGLVGDNGDYSAIIEAIADAHKVKASAVAIQVKRGSIVLNYSIYNKTPPTIPTKSSFIADIGNAILNNDVTNLTFSGPVTSTTLTSTTNIFGETSSKENTSTLFDLFETNGLTLPSSPAFSCVFDNVGNYFLAYPHKIYKVTADGIVSVFAGGNDSGYVDGNGANARFFFPALGDYGAEMAIDSSNNLYVSDTFNNRIRKIDPVGNVTTLAGSGLDVDSDGIGVAAGISTPLGMTIDASDNLYVTSSATHIRQINIATQNVTTLDVRSSNQVYKYVTLRCDGASNNLYALDYRGSSDINVVYRIANRRVLEFEPTSIVKDSSGNFYLSDRFNNKIKKIDTSGKETTFAGSTEGYLDGQGGAAQFYRPLGITIDSSDNLYVCDSGNHKIRKIDINGNVTTIAGGGAGFAEGVGAAAGFSYPGAITIDSAGNLYVADTNNHKIRKIDSSRNVTTIAGSTQGFSAGQGDTAQFDNPVGITIDSTGNLYIADTRNYRVRKITSSGVVSTFAGSSDGYVDGLGSVAKFSTPYALTIDSSNDLYVADRYNRRIRKIDTGGNVITPATLFFIQEVFAGYPGVSSTSSSEINGYRTAARFQSVDTIDLDSRGNLYVGEKPYRRIRFIDSTGNVSTLIKDDFNVQPGTISPGLILPSIVGITKSGRTKLRCQNQSGKIYEFSQELNKIGAPLAVVTTIAGSTSGFADGQESNARFASPGGIAVDVAGNMYVTDTNNHKIRKITLAGVVSLFAGSSEGSADGQGAGAQFKYPSGMTIDRNGNLYVCDSGNHRIRKIDTSGNVTTFAGSSEGAREGQGINAQFSNPMGITIDSVGYLYVADTGNHRIRRITPSGLVRVVAGQINGYAENLGTNARFSSPTGIAVDSLGILYVADRVNNKIRKIDEFDRVTTFAGSGAKGTDNRTGTDAQFNNPMGITIDSAGNLYVTDSGNHRIRKIDTSRNVTTIAGANSGNIDGQGTAAGFNNPLGITIDSSGNLYVADRDNHKFRKITFI